MLGVAVMLGWFARIFGREEPPENKGKRSWNKQGCAYSKGETRQPIKAKNEYDVPGQYR